MDDLDDLLSDLNATLGGGGKPAAPIPAVPPRPASGRSQNLQTSQTSASSQSGGGSALSTKPQQSGPALGGDIDDLLADLNCLSPPKSMKASVQPSTTPVKQAPPRMPSARGVKMAKKCSCVTIGGTQFEQGLAGFSGTVCCDRMRCTKCDLIVVSFENAKWSSDAEYMFFRNCYPNEDKLRPKLLNCPGSRAYCCQCTWTEKTTPEHLGYNSPFRWVCRGHS
ncbi:hypothetical protein CYMTET_48972 [Cymbomonas tetramitiformis]|uniref:Cilia- and flagella-associated protein 418 n=1 Tax=Cymbomonas tetramitiformis TaxID=36881 RepID=A0AAE0BR45_9CHLO|nr:hypothetical protein CYMTET_48972 [Cymbomonas tetramitiformis]